MAQMNLTHGADYIILLIDNTQETYKQKHYMFENLVKKVKNGSYDRTKAPKLFSYLTDKVRKSFNKEYAGESDSISIASARLADKELVHEFETDYLPNEKKMFFKSTAQTGKF